MKKIIKITFFAFLFVGFLSTGLSSCHKGPSCPAYNNIDPGRGNMNNPNNVARKTGNNKRDVERQKRKELSGAKKKYNRKKSTNLLPRHLR